LNLTYFFAYSLLKFFIDKIIMPFLYSKMIKGGTLGGGSFSSQNSRIMDSSKETRQKIPTL
jgi:hypothetical protein